MIKIKKHIWYYRGYDIIYSPDEGGYYAVRDKISKLYKTLQEVKKAIDKNTV